MQAVCCRCHVLMHADQLGVSMARVSMASGNSVGTSVIVLDCVPGTLKRLSRVLEQTWCWLQCQRSYWQRLSTCVAVCVHDKACRAHL